jgi:AcrR family transcriptional regulator
VARRTERDPEKRKPPRRDPRQDRSEETLRIILDATELTLAEVGTARITTAAIAARAGVGTGTLFHYFPTKAALLAAWEERSVLRAAAICTKELEGLFATSPPLDYCIRRLVHVGCALLAEHVAICSGGRRDARQSLATLSRLEQRLAVAARSADIIASALQFARDANLVRPKRLPLAAALALKTTIAMAYLGARDHEEEFASGVFQEELGSMVCRYLLGDDADKTARDELDVAVNLPRLYGTLRQG